MKIPNAQKFNFTKIGVAIVVLANPLFYLAIAASIIDIKNLFGAGLDRRSVSFNTNDPFIQAMTLVSIVGFLFLIYGYYNLIRTKSKL